MSVEASERPGAAPSRQGEPLLRVTALRKYFPITQGILIQHHVGDVHAVDGVDLEVYPGETVGLVGETGCGKSTLARVVTRLFEPTDGTVEFDGRDITKLKGSQLRQVRRDMQMVFQDPYASLNPRKTVGTIIGAPFRLHKTVPSDKVKGEVQQLMELVGLNPEHYNRFPHEFSGGQRQRIGIARALAVNPKLIVADEPVSALDVSVQAQILNLLKDLQSEFGLTYIFIAHDLSVVRHISDRVAVMYLGKVVELARSRDLYRAPRHPYTGALLSAVPIANPRRGRGRSALVLTGDVPNPINPPTGCRFHPRCPRAAEACAVDDPELVLRAEGHETACFLPLERWPLTAEEMRTPERELVPCARSPFSHKITDRPRPAASRAMPQPLMPPPMMRRSTVPRSVMTISSDGPAARRRDNGAPLQPRCWRHG